MKRFLSMILVALMLLLSLASCKTGGGNTKPAATVYDTLNELAQKDYSNVIIDLSSTLNGETLQDRYTVMQLGENTIVQYSVQRRSVFEEGQIPDSFYTTHQGQLVISDGKITSGNAEDINFTAINVKALSFDAAYFSDVEAEAGKFSATVQNPAGFFGESSIDVSAVTLALTYAARLQTLTLTYTAPNGAEVVIMYEFM